MGRKFVRDPVHDVIEIECEFTDKVIDTEVFQRLRRIKQLGLASLVYPGADHSRFSHSLGAFHLAKKLVAQISKTNDTFNDLEKRALPISALCHDIGHGPFSHLFEKVIKGFVKDKDHAKHDYWSVQILKNSPEIQEVFKKDSDLGEAVWKIVSKGYPKASVVDVVSSELDVDRLDYLLRDSHMTGVQYGNLDLAWILRCIQPADLPQKEGESPITVLAFDATRGMSVIESYILGRHYMYRHLYWYHTVRSAELMLKGLLNAVMTLTKNDSQSRVPLHPIIATLARTGVIGLSDYLKLDDLTIWSWIDELIEHGGPFGDVAHRIKSRRVFRTIIFSRDIDTNKLRTNISKTNEIAKKYSLDPELYVIYDDPSDVAMKSRTYLKAAGEEHKYQPLYYFEKSKSDESKKIFELNDSNNFANGISYAEKRLYVADEMYEEAKKVWES